MKLESSEESHDESCELHLPAVFETKVFPNQNNGITVWQDDGSGHEQMVVLNKIQAKKVAQHILKLIKSVQFDA